MPTTHCFAPILGKRIRVTQLNDDGTLGTQYIVTDGFITVTLAAQIEAGTEILQRNAAGILCINELLSPNFKRLTVDVEFCNVNPSLLSFVTNAQEYNDYAGDAAGFTIGEGLITGAFALEIWTGLAGSINDDNANGYMMLPYVHKGHLDDIKLTSTAATNFNLKNGYTQGGNSWGVGPFSVVMNNDSPGVASKLPTSVDPFDHLLVMDTSVAAPPSACAPSVIA